jgi:hypothetical protein
MLGGLIAESGPGRMSFHLLLRQARDLTWLELNAVEPESSRGHAVVAPAGITLAQVEELAACSAVAVEIDTERRLLGSGECSGKAACAVQKIIEAGGQRGVVRDLGCEFGTYISGVHHR